MAQLNNNNNNNNQNNDLNVEEHSEARDYIGKFFFYLQQETGLTKKAFTTAGFESYLKKIAKNCFQLQIYGDLLQSLIKIALIFTRAVNDKIEKYAEVFVRTLHKISNFLVKYWLGRGLLMLSTGLSGGMTFFLISLFHVVMFVLDRVSLNWFYKLKGWIIMLFNHEKVKCFFDEVFPTYGRAVTYA